MNYLFFIALVVLTIIFDRVGCKSISTSELEEMKSLLHSTVKKVESLVSTSIRKSNFPH